MEYQSSAEQLQIISPLCLLYLHKAHPYAAAHIKRPAGMCRNALKKIDAVFQRARFNLVKYSISVIFSDSYAFKQSQTLICKKINVA